MHTKKARGNTRVVDNIQMIRPRIRAEELRVPEHDASEQDDTSVPANAYYTLRRTILTTLGAVLMRILRVTTIITRRASHRTTATTITHITILGVIMTTIQ